MLSERELKNIERQIRTKKIKDRVIIRSSQIDNGEDVVYTPKQFAKTKLVELCVVDESNQVGDYNVFVSDNDRFYQFFTKYEVRQFYRTFDNLHIEKEMMEKVRVDFSYIPVQVKNLETHSTIDVGVDYVRVGCQFHTWKNFKKNLRVICYDHNEDYDSALDLFNALQNLRPVIESRVLLERGVVSVP